MDMLIRMQSATQSSASCSYSVQSRSLASGCMHSRPAMQSATCRQGVRQRPALPTCSTPALSLGCGLQRSVHQCSRLAVARPGACKAVLDVGSAPLQHEQLPSLKHIVSSPFGDLSEGLETPVQLLYLVTLLGFLVVGAYLVVRQVLVRRELEEAAKVLGERIRTNDASPEDCFELGVILLRKKLYTQATKNLEKASRMWDGEPEELAQVHNALGFAYFNMDRSELAMKNYRRAVELQPGYTTAWNNLGDAYEKVKDWDQAMKAYEETLAYSPDNKVARSRVDSLRNKVSMAR